MVGAGTSAKEGEDVHDGLHGQLVKARRSIGGWVVVRRQRAFLVSVHLGAGSVISDAAAATVIVLIELCVREGEHAENVSVTETASQLSISGGESFNGPHGGGAGE